MKMPTARDISRDSLRSGRIAPSGPSVSVGAAMANFGQDLLQAGYNLQSLKEKENVDLLNKRGNDTSTALTNFLNDEEQRFLKSRDESTESGIGFTRSYIEGWEKRADEFAKSNFAGLSDDDQTRFNNAILSRGNTLYEKAFDFETKAKTAYYDRNTNTSLDKVRTQIQGNAAPYDQLKAQGLEAINSADMPEQWKAERRAQWDADASESKWRWKFKQDPDTAVRQMRGINVDAKGLAGAIKQTAEQLGIDPVDLATVMSYETGGTFDPWKAGPVTKWGQHRGLIQWGEPQRQKYGVTADMPIGEQVAAAGRYLRDAGVTPGMGLLDIYSAVNAGAPGLYDRSDYKQGGAPGTVADKVKYQMEQHKEKAAALLGGTYTPSANDPDLDAIPYERREQLANWGETEYNQQRTLQRTQAKDAYSLMIATRPEAVDEAVILRDQTIDNGDKAQLINSLRSAMKETGQVNSFINALGGGSASVNPFDSEQTKVADKAYEKMVNGATDDQKAVVSSGFVSGTGYIPKPLQAELRRGAVSNDIGMVMQSMTAADVLQKNAPIAFGAFEGGADVRKNLELYRTYTNSLGFTPDEAARRIIDSNDPEKVRARDALLKSEPIKKLIDGIDANTVGNQFDTWLSSQPAVGGSLEKLPDQLKLGVNADAEAVIVQDYRDTFREALVDTNGNQDAAMKLATERFSKRYAPSQFTVYGSNVIVRNAPEIAYPAAPDGTHDYIREQALDGLKQLGVTTGKVYLQPDQTTEKDIRAGRPPRYRVLFEGETGLQLAPNYFTADPSGLKDKAQEESLKRVEDAERRMTEMRQQTVEEGEARDRALRETIGPDWMKARAAETAVEKQRMNRAFGGPINPDTAPPSTIDKNGGGGGF